MNEQRLAEILDEEGAQPLAWWWLSFCDPSRPEGSQFLGACLIQAPGLAHAVMLAHRKGCNPGGEIAAHSVPLEAKVQDGWADRLLTREQCEEFDRVHRGKL